MEKLSIEEAYKLLEEAPRNNKELWIKHSVNVAIVAERLADQLNLDGKKAYVLGLVGYEEEGRVCLTHTFYARNLVIPNLTKKDTNLTRNEIVYIADYINNNGFNEYDKILQIADNMGSASGINTIERRRTESMLRYGITDVSEKNLRGIFNVQAEIEAKLGFSIYYLFPEVSDNISKTLIKDVIKIKNK